MLMMERYISIYRNLLAKSILTIDYSYPPSPSEPLSLPLPLLEPPPEGVCEPEVEPEPLSPADGALALPSGSFTDAETEAKEVLALGSTTTAPSTTLYIPFAIIIPRRVE